MYNIFLDESTRREEHEAAYGLLSLSQKTSQNVRRESTSPLSTAGSDTPINVLNIEEIAHVSKTTYAKNKILDDKTPLNFSAPKVTTPPTTSSESDEAPNLSQFLGKTTINRPLTYPYTSVLPQESHEKEVDKPEGKSIKQFHVIQKYASHSPNKIRESPKHVDNSVTKSGLKDRTRVVVNNSEVAHVKVNNVQPPVLKVNDAVVLGDNESVTDLRKRKLSFVESDYDRVKKQKNDEVMDLSMPTEKNTEIRY